MKLETIVYSELNARQKEIYNFHKVASLLADYGFNCIKLADDWQGADFLAYHKDGDSTLRVQLKARVTISRKYLGKKLYMAFPVAGHWCLIEHDELVRLVGETTNWLKSDSWRVHGGYSAGKPPKALLESLHEKMIGPDNRVHLR